MTHIPQQPAFTAYTPSAVERLRGLVALHGIERAGQQLGWTGEFTRRIARQHGIDEPSARAVLPPDRAVQARPGNEDVTSRNPADGIPRLPLARAQLVWDAGTRTLSRGGKWLTLSEHLARLFDEFHKAAAGVPARPLTRIDLEAAIGQAVYPSALYRLGASIATLGLAVDSFKGPRGGYSLACFPLEAAE